MVSCGVEPTLPTLPTWTSSPVPGTGSELVRRTGSTTPLVLGQGGCWSWARVGCWSWARVGCWSWARVGVPVCPPVTVCARSREMGSNGHFSGHFSGHSKSRGTTLRAGLPAGSGAASCRHRSGLVPAPERPSAGRRPSLCRTATVPLPNGDRPSAERRPSLELYVGHLDHPSVAVAATDPQAGWSMASRHIPAASVSWGHDAT